MLELFVNIDLFYILVNNGIKADLQGVEYSPYAFTDKDYPLKHILLLVEYNFLNAYSMVKNIYHDDDNEFCFLYYMLFEFESCSKDKYEDIMKILKLLISQVKDISSLGHYRYRNFYSVMSAVIDEGEKGEKLKALFEEQGLDINPPKVSPKGLKYYPATLGELMDLCDDLSVNLADIDIGLLTNLDSLFESSKREDYSGIETWDTSNILSMSCTFYNNEIFNTDISSWDVSNVKDMSKMFCFASNFNQPLNAWDVSNVENMESMFQGASAFNQPLDKWNPISVKDIRDMFLDAHSFCQNLDSWKIEEVLGGYESTFYRSPLWSNPPSWSGFAKEKENR
ncbi:BspA family leucine-rich repeat surface protein [uncultured Brachyspira sp.]|uniref:BspA family leucine-rich repeat surface protein n=1 Tax=uncultured Brachyspira sp. TaxID=221953 RepID=UPI0026047582|nr:BspA family leucine-rich repeat surface protein [uncultured Brachyspira sp.]